MLKAVVVIGVLSLCVGAELEAEWTAFKSQFNKQYQGDHEPFRKQVFADNLDYIQRHNREADNGLHTYWLGVNQYSDMSHKEFVAVMLGFRYNPDRVSTNQLYVPQIKDEAVPSEVDWRTKGYVTPVKNQGQCGSCWAFSTTGSLEGQHFKATKKLVSLSEQNLVDCSRKEGNMGCMGGLMDSAFKYVKKNGGLDTEASYPYIAKNEKCHFKKKEVGATLKSWTDVKKGDEKQLEKAVAEIGPISVAIDASHPSFQHYKKGVYSEKKCSSKRLDHGVLAAGYGVEQGDKYWLVKNSWGKSWGMEGYILMTKDKDNQCGIATSASFPVV